MLKKYMNTHNYLIVGGFLAAFLLLSSFVFSTKGISGATGMIAAQSPEALVLHLFWGDGCGYCANEKVFLEQLGIDYPDLDIQMHEVWKNQSNQDLFKEFAAAYGTTAGGVPATFIGERNWVGYNTALGNEMIAYIETCQSNPCPSKI